MVPSAVKDLDLSELNPPLNAILVTDQTGLDRIADFFERTQVFGFDTETNITPTFFHRKIRTIQVGDKHEQYVIDLLAFAGSTADLIAGQGKKQTSEWAVPIVQTLQPALISNSHTKVGHHLQFDYEVVRWCIGLRTWNVYDTELAEKVIHCGRVNFFQQGFWALDDCVARYCRIRVNKALQQSFDLESPLTQDQVNYAALDTRLALAVRSGQLPILKKAGLERAAKLEFDALPSAGDAKLNGFYLDKDDWMVCVNANLAKHEENIKTLDTFFLSVVGSKEKPIVDLERMEQEWKDEKDKDARMVLRKAFYLARKTVKDWETSSLKWEGEAAINYAGNSQLLQALYKMGFTPKQLPNTNDKTLSALSNEPVIQAIQNYRETDKQKTTYGVDFLDHIDPDTERIHSTINQLGAATGRTSSTKPNMQNITKGSAVRGCFKALPGYKLITVDMSGAELRIMAELSGQQSWIDAFNAGWDVHSLGAAMMYTNRWTEAAEPGCEYVEKHTKCSCKGHKALREKCKATNFKVAYGGMDLSADLKITKKESDDILKLWGSTFNVLLNYLNESGLQARMRLESRTFSGRRRLYNQPTWEAAKVNAAEWAKKHGKDPLQITSKDISRAYNMMFFAIERQGKNTPIQGGNIDVAKAALAFMWSRLEPEFGALLVNFVHDEFVVECPEENAEACKQFIQYCIREGAAEFMHKVVMESEGNISDRWSK